MTGDIIFVKGEKEISVYFISKSSRLSMGTIFYSFEWDYFVWEQEIKKLTISADALQDITDKLKELNKQLIKEK